MEEARGIIYVIRCKKNDKVYVGQTVCKLQDRWHAHKQSARRCMFAMQKGEGHRFSKIARKMAKYGTDNFTIEVLKECEISHLSAYERVYIRELDACKRGYNTTA